jgi:hypothetical protein
MPKNPKDDYYDLDGPGKADKHPDKTTQFDRYDWSRDSKPEQNYSTPEPKRKDK